MKERVCRNDYKRKIIKEILLERCEKNDFGRRFWKEDCERKIVRDIKRQIKSVGLKEKACGDVESHFGPFSSIFAESKKMGYGRNNGLTNRHRYPLIEMPEQIKSVRLKKKA